MQRAVEAGKTLGERLRQGHDQAHVTRKCKQLWWRISKEQF